MDVAALFLHNMRQGTCPAWGFSSFSSHTQEDIERVNEIFRQHTPFEVDAGFNEWILSVMHGEDDFLYITCKRFTWDNPWSTRSWKELEEKVDQYYFS